MDAALAVPSKQNMSWLRQAPTEQVSLLRQTKYIPPNNRRAKNRPRVNFDVVSRLELTSVLAHYCSIIVTHWTEQSQLILRHTSYMEFSLVSGMSGR